MKRFAAIMLLACCIPATYKAGVRRLAETKLKACGQSVVCYAEVRTYCRDRGLEKTCGEGIVYDAR